jgi:hypothetical protein
MLYNQTYLVPLGCTHVFCLKVHATLKLMDTLAQSGVPTGLHRIPTPPWYTSRERIHSTICSAKELDHLQCQQGVCWPFQTRMSPPSLSLQETHVTDRKISIKIVYDDLDLG